MNLYNNEKYILNIIKFGPILLVIILSFFITQFFLQNRYKNFQNEIKITEKAYLEKNKERVREEVLRVYNYINTQKEQSKDKLLEEIKSKVYEAHKIATNIYNEEKNNNNHPFDKEHTFRNIKSILSSIRFNNGRGYIFMDDINGTKLIQPTNKSFEGKNFLNYKDAKGYKFVKKIVETIKKKGEDFDSYYWYKGNNQKKAYKKISFYKYFAPYQAAIGAGEYVEDFNLELKKQILKNIREIRYGENGYIFVYNSKGLTLTTYRKDFIDKNRLNDTNNTGKYFIKDIISFAKNHKNGGFLDYISATNPNGTLSSTRKISYLIYLEDWDWIIGSGFYLDALHKDIEEKKTILEKSTKEAIKDITYISVIITIIFILISTFMSKLISNKFIKYRQTIEKEIADKIEKEKLLLQQSKMATMGEMIANIAHQWKQPLSIISASNSMLKLQKEMNNKISEENLTDAIEAIDVSVNNLSNTIDDFRNFFNPNKLSEYFSIKKAFDKTFRLINTHLKNYDVKIITDIDDIEINSLQNELLQILINIIKNAKDELVIKKELKERLILISAKQKDSFLIISIKDNAGGVPEEIIDKIFDSYFTTKKDRDGTGIGLYMSKQIINNLKGTIEVQNSKFKYKDTNYKGAEFIIKLPITK